MGQCGGVKKYKLQIPKQLLSNRAINEEDSIAHKNSFTSHACGYGFAIDQNEVELVRLQKLIVRKQEERQKFQELAFAYEQLNHSYKVHKIDDSVKWSEKVLAKIKLIDFTLIDENDLPTEEQLNMLIKEIRIEHEDVEGFEQEISKGGWVAKSEDKGIKISSRREGQTVGILVEAIIDVPVEIFLSVVSEFQLFKHFVPFMEESTCEKSIHRNNKIGFCRNNFPFISRREAFYQGVGYNRLDHNNTIFLFSRSIHNRPDLCKKLNYSPSLNQGNVTMDYKYFVVTYEPLDQKRGKVRLAMNIDMKLSFVPMSILDYSCQNFGEDFFLNIVKISKKFEGSHWEQNIKRDPSAFNFYKECIDQYFQKQKK